MLPLSAEDNDGGFLVELNFTRGMSGLLPDHSLLILGVCGLIAAPVSRADTTWDYAVQISASVQISPPQVTLSWPAPSDATGYTVCRKLFTDASWPAGTSIGTSTTYTDSSVSV